MARHKVGASAVGHAERLRDRRHDALGALRRCQPDDPGAARVLVQQRPRRDQGQTGLSGAAAPREGDELRTVGEEGGPDGLELFLAADERSHRRRQVRRAHGQRPRRREGRRPLPVDHQVEEPLRGGEVLQPVLAEVIGGRLRRQHRPRGGGDQDLAAVRRGRHPRRAVHLEPDIAGGAMARVAGVHAHPHPRFRPRPQASSRPAQAPLSSPPPATAPAPASPKTAKKASPSVRSTQPRCASMAPLTQAWSV